MKTEIKMKKRKNSEHDREEINMIISKSIESHMQVGYTLGSRQTELPDLVPRA